MISRTALCLRCGTLPALLGCVAFGQIPDSPAAVVADIPVNYTEANAGTYSLPELLKMNDGRVVRDAGTWTTKRRPEIRKLIEDNWFGRAPGRPSDMWFDVVEQAGSAFDGKAVRRQVVIYFSKDRS